MNLLISILIIYLIILVPICIRIIFETHSTNKTIAYLLFCTFIPVIGIIFYITFGVNYWKLKKYNKKSNADKNLLLKIEQHIKQFSEVTVLSNDDSVKQNAELSSMLLRDLGSPLTGGNKIKLLINGENKFPNMLKEIKNAKQHIHLEYYIFESDKIGSELIEILIQKAKEGIEVKMIYDDFGSPAIKKKIESRLRDAGIEVFPFYKIQFYFLANRINYRNHRKIVVVDGCTAFVGGINVSDRYINKNKDDLFWRDTHVRIDGPAVYYLQYLFMADWHFCCGKYFVENQKYFPVIKPFLENSYAQITASGPNSIQPSVMYSILQAIYLAKEEILITTPYFIPGDSINDALKVAALSGLKVKLLVPGVCDSKIVNAASQSNYNDLLIAGVEIYLYQKGFVHAKTMVTDGKLVILGTANMDRRSFDLNFEVNAILYDTKTANELRDVFFNDLQYSEKINREQWLQRKWYIKFPEKLARLLSPVL